MDSRKSKEVLLAKLKSINEVSKMLMQCQSVEEVVRESLKKVREQLKVQVASIFLFTKEGVIERIGIDGNDKDNQSIKNDWLFEEDRYKPGESFSGKAMPQPGIESAYGEPQYSNNILYEYGYMNNGEKYKEKLGGLRCGISVPLNGLNRTFGTLEVLNKDKSSGNGFTEDDVYWLMLIGTNVANIISDLRRREKLKMQHFMIEKLISVEATENSFNLEEIYKLVADRLTSGLTYYKACIIRIADDKEDLEIREKSYTSDISWETRVDGSVKTGSQIVGEVHKTQEPRFIDNIDEEISKFNNKNWIELHELKSFACLPLSVKNKCVGTISVYAGYHHKFSKIDKYFLQDIAFLTAAIIARVRIINELRKVREELNQKRENFFNISKSLQFGSILQIVLHKYKNELIEIHHNLGKLSSKSNTSKKEKEKIVNEQMNWIQKRIEEIQLEFQSVKSIAAPVNINQLVKNVIKLLLFDAKNIKFEEKYNEEIPIIEIQEAQIKDIIYNVISNAIIAVKIAKRKDGKILVNTDLTTSEKIDYIQITIEDNGGGIKNEDRERIFEQGFTTREEKGGTGMGLYIAQEIMKEYGGKIYFDSKWGKGTKFFIKIPLKRFKI